MGSHSVKVENIPNLWEFIRSMKLKVTSKYFELPFVVSLKHFSARVSKLIQQNCIKFVG